MTAPRTKSSRHPRLVAVVQDDCTGCNSCVDYCLVDCIESSPPAFNAQSVTPISIREDECIGCFVCAKICDALTTHAIAMVPAR